MLRFADDEVVAPARTSIESSGIDPVGPPQPNVALDATRASCDHRLLQAFSYERLARAAPHLHVNLQNWRGMTISTYRCRPGQDICTVGLDFPRW